MFQRRIRVKDAFSDFDRLKCGRCTQPQFLRALRMLVPFLLPSDCTALMEHFTEKDLQLLSAQAVNYQAFVTQVEEVFTVPGLERMPTREVQKPGQGLVGSKLHFRPAVVKDEGALDRLLARVALLCTTRGVVLRTCFQDAERSMCTSLRTPRFSGKVTPAQFWKQFPFSKDVSPEEQGLIESRYTTDSGDIHYVAFHEDVVGKIADLHDRSRPVPALLLEAKSPTSAHGGYSAGGFDRGHVVHRLKAIIKERRLRPAGVFVEFDRMRHGLCTIREAGTALTILGLQLSHKDEKDLVHLFGASDGMFNYHDFCKAVQEAQLPAVDAKALDATLLPAAAPTSGRQRLQLDEKGEAELQVLEASIAKRMTSLATPLKTCFQDFDQTHRGYVTKTQFLRVMDMVRVPLSQQQQELLSQAYVNPGGQFGYIDFCQSIDALKGTKEPVELTELCTALLKRPSKYFNGQGQVARLEPWRKEISARLQQMSQSSY